jgi:hypothetical protein
VPPAPEQDKEYVLLPVVDGVTVSLPPVAFVPDQSPEAVQLVAFVLDQLSVTDWPMIIDDGEAEIETVGAGGEELPPPLQPARRSWPARTAMLQTSLALMGPPPKIPPIMKSTRWENQPLRSASRLVQDQ